MECRLADCPRETWDTRVSAAGGALSQSWAWGEACARQVDRLEVVRDGRTLALAQVIARPMAAGFSLGLLSRGPVMTDPGADPGAVVAALARRGPLIVTPPHALGRGVAPSLPLMTPATLAIWDLAPTEAALRAGLHQKWRNRLARAEAAGLKIGRDGDPAWLLQREERARRARGYRGLPADFVARLCAAPGSHLLLTARARGEVIAAALFLRHGSGATYQTGWSGQEGRRRDAMRQILWQGALWLKARGAGTLDLGMLDTRGAPGLARFKLGTGAAVQRLGTTSLVWSWPRRRAAA